MNTTTVADKILRTLYPTLHPHYFTENGRDYPDMIKGEIDTRPKMYLTQNFHGKFSMSSSNKYGKIIIDDKEFKKIITDELSKERPSIPEMKNQIEDLLDERIMENLK